MIAANENGAVHPISEQKSSYWQSQAGVSQFVNGTDVAQNHSYRLNEIFDNLFLNYCPRGSKVLDLGCGHGLLSKFLADNGLQVISCDISEALLGILNNTKGSRDITTRIGSAYNIPAATNEFDVVVARMFLMHFPDWQKIVTEMSRVVRPGGKVVFQFASKENEEIAELYARHPFEPFLKNDTRREPGRFMSDASAKEMKELCDQIGMRLVTVHPCVMFDNRIFGHAVGTQEYEKFYAQFREWIKDEKVFQFMLWFEQNMVRNLPPFMAYNNIVVLEKA